MGAIGVVIPAVPDAPAVRHARHADAQAGRAAGGLVGAAVGRVDGRELEAEEGRVAVVVLREEAPPGAGGAVAWRVWCGVDVMLVAQSSQWLVDGWMGWRRD